MEYFQKKVSNFSQLKHFEGLQQNSDKEQDDSPEMFKKMLRILKNALELRQE